MRCFPYSFIKEYAKVEKVNKVAMHPMLAGLARNSVNCLCKALYMNGTDKLGTITTTTTTLS
jgi:hypothetical protein